MIEMNKKEKIERLNLYKNSKTYTFLKDAFGYFYNGYILTIDDRKIMFQDDVIKLPIPIDLDNLKVILPSKKNRSWNK